jgi:ribonuclease III
MMTYPDFKNPALLLQAFTHKSFHNENLKDSVGDNERLEFLGDAVLDLVLSDHLFHANSEMSEGELSKIRASLVNETTLAEVAQEMRLGDHLKLGRGETQSGGALKPRLLASGFEALTGAIYLDQGYAAVKSFLLEKFAAKMAALDTQVHYRSDYKTRLQEKVQEVHRRTPAYELVKEEGPDHDKTFSVNILLDNKILGSGSGKSKKQAEQEAARVALERLDAEEKK